jgi:deoxyribodipyrimidine photo-lyase
MDRDRRLHHNWALLHAQNCALESQSELHILYALPKIFLESTWRQYHFLIEGLKELSGEAKKYNIRFEALFGEPDEMVLEYAKKHKVGSIVTDFSPLKITRKWRGNIAKKTDVLMEEVDAHNIVPCWEASTKLEFAAYTIRPKIHKKLEHYFRPIPALLVHPHKAEPGKTDWKSIEKQLNINRSIPPVNGIEPGEKAAQKAMRHFLEKKIEEYSELRNDPNADATSNLSPYLHFGQLSAQQLAIEAEEIAPGHAGVFLEELIVRRELSDNFCFYNPNYDSVAGFHEWAQKTLEEHRGDKREYLYNKDEFESAKTHDDLWNAAQSQLVQTGKIHGYMRMYWAKKILEWTKSPEQALEIAIFLNDKYALDGCDPNGYVGIAWSVGGVHDRAWTEREVFGKIRYMNANGCKRKFDTQKYIDTWQNGKTELF